MSKKLHILFLCGWYPSKVLPTNGDFIQRHAESVALLHNVSVLHIITDKNASKTEHVYFEKNNVKTHIAYVKNSNNVVTKFKLFYKAYKTILKKIEHFDVVHLNELYPFGIFAIHLKWTLKKPYIISEHWHGYKFPFSKNISFSHKIIGKLITKHAAFVCPVSNDLQNAMQKAGYKGNYKSVPNVVDTDIFTAKNKQNKQFTIIHISSMHKVKNVPDILEVVKNFKAEIDDFKFYLIGENSKQYEPLIDKFDIKKNTVLIDHIPQQNLVKKLQNASVFVLFSSTENQPCVILESFACGTPVISTNVGGIAENFPEKFGILIKKDNKNELLKELINCYKKQHSFIAPQKMHAYVKENFSNAKIATLFTQLYLKALANEAY